MAFLTHGSVLYYSSDSVHPVGTLLEGIWHQFPDQARSMTRNRIFSWRSLTPLCDGMLKVVGKRHTLLSEEEYFCKFQELSKNHELKLILVPMVLKKIEWNDLPLNSLTSQEAMSLAHKMALNSDLKIGAVLLDQEMRFVAGGWNHHHQNRILHAEIMMIKNFQSNDPKRKIPKNYSVFSTLQPCSMCAGYLYQYSESFESLTIVFDQEDQGPFAQNSVLVKNSPLWRKVYL